MAKNTFIYYYWTARLVVDLRFSLFWFCTLAHRTWNKTMIIMSKCKLAHIFKDVWWCSQPCKLQPLGPEETLYKKWYMYNLLLI